MSAWWEAIGGLSNHVPNYVQNFRKPPEDMSLYQNRKWEEAPSHQGQKSAFDLRSQPDCAASSRDPNVIDVEARVIKTDGWDG